MTKPETSFIEGDKATFTFKISKDQLGNEVKELLTKEGYKIETGNETNGVYGKGNDIMVLLLGGFAKRFRYPVEITEVAGQSTLIMQNGTSAKILGGAIGISKHRKEFERLVKLISQE